MQRKELGKPVLVEKPIALLLKDADDILAALRQTGGHLRVGYSRRFKECYLRAKEQMLRGRLGRVVGGTARVYNSRAQAFAILKRDPHAESGLPGYRNYGWFSLLTPAKTPGTIIMRLNRAISEAVNSADVKQKFVDIGVDPASNSLEELAKLIREQLELHRKVVRELGIKFD